VYGNYIVLEKGLRHLFRNDTHTMITSLGVVMWWQIQTDV